MRWRFVFLVCLGAAVVMGPGCSGRGAAADAGATGADAGAEASAEAAAVYDPAACVPVFAKFNNREGLSQEDYALIIGQYEAVGVLITSKMDSLGCVPGMPEEERLAIFGQMMEDPAMKQAAHDCAKMEAILVDTPLDEANRRLLGDVARRAAERH